MPPSPAKPLGIVIVDNNSIVADNEKFNARLWMKDSEHNPKQMDEWPVIALVIEENGEITISEEDL